MLLHPTKCIGNAIGKIYFIVFVFEIIGKLQFVIKFRLVIFIIQPAFYISDEGAVSFPLCVLGCFNTNAHALMVKTMRLCKVQDCKIYISDVILIFNRKVKPLMMTPSVSVNSHVQLKISCFLLNNHVKIA
jgi:hypothetical protein